jgi:hypothetical protein
MNVWDFLNSILHREPEYPSLERYVDIELERRVDPRRDAALAITLSTLTLAALASLGFWFAVGSPALAWAAAAIGTLGAAAWIGRYYGKLSDAEKELTQARKEARSFLFDLHKWKRRRWLKRCLAGGIGELLDSGAQYWHRTQAALNSDGWEVEDAAGAWASIRRRAIHAMESAMARLLIMASDAQEASVSFISPAFEPARKLVEEMREMAKQAERLADRRRAGSVQEGGPTNELREALAEMQRLEAAESEVQGIALS